MEPTSIPSDVKCKREYNFTKNKVALLKWGGGGWVKINQNDLYKTYYQLSLQYRFSKIKFINIIVVIFQKKVKMDTVIEGRKNLKIGLS